MGKNKVNKELLINFIVDSIKDHPKDIMARTAAKFNVSRQTVYRYMKDLIAADLIETLGNGNKKEYRLRTTEHAYTLKIDGSWDEETVWRQYVRPLLLDLSPNVLEICHYGVGEMTNNVLEHADATQYHITISIDALKIQFRISDDGIGIFSKIQHDFHLDDKNHAILELAKGKLTSDPEHHTGEGIFFTSRMFDQFMIISEDVAFIGVDNIDVLFPDRENCVEGTLVVMTISKNSNNNIKEVFDRFTPDLNTGEFGFQKTIVAVKLLQNEGDTLVSRSQGKRLTARFDHFKEVVLDFSDVTFIGQPFADEVFRVFRKNFPDTHLHTVNSNADIDNMIKHVMANA